MFALFYSGDPGSSFQHVSWLKIIVVLVIILNEPELERLFQKPYTKFIPFHLRLTERAVSNGRLTGRKVTKLPGHNAVVKVKQSKGKIHPRTGHESPEREYRYSPTLSLTSALDEGG
jgi:hypothetical protein